MPSNIEEGEEDSTKAHFKRNESYVEDSESWMNASIRIGRSESNKAFDIQPIAPPEESDTASSSESYVSLAEAKELPVIQNVEIVIENDPVRAVECQEEILDSTQSNSEIETNGQQNRHNENADGLIPDVSRFLSLHKR